MNTCTHCGEMLAPESRYCPNCGTKVQKVGIAQKSTEEMQNKIEKIMEKYSALTLPESVIERIVRANYADTESDHFSEEKISGLITENIYYSDIKNIVKEYLKFISHDSDLYVEELCIHEIENKTTLERLLHFLELFDRYREYLSHDKISEAGMLLSESKFLNRHCRLFNFMKTTCINCNKEAV